MDSNNVSWKGEPTAELTAVGEQLQSYVDAHPSTATGVSYCLDYSSVEVFVTNPESSEPTILATLSPSHSKLVLVRHSTNSLQALRQGVASATKTLKALKVDAVVGPDPTKGGIIAAAHLPTKGGLVGIGDVESALRASVPEGIPVVLTEFKEARNSTRADDAPPFYMGGEIASSSETCSLGLPIVIGGVRRALTAGHCDGGNFYNNGTFVGSQYTTAYPSNADIYGDWKLLSGSTYGTRVFSGSLSRMPR